MKKIIVSFLIIITLLINNFTFFKNKEKFPKNYINFSLDNKNSKFKINNPNFITSINYSKFYEKNNIKNKEYLNFIKNFVTIYQKINNFLKIIKYTKNFKNNKTNIFLKKIKYNNFKIIKINFLKQKNYKTNNTFFLFKKKKYTNFLKISIIKNIVNSFKKIFRYTKKESTYLKIKNIILIFYKKNIKNFFIINNIYSKIKKFFYFFTLSNEIELNFFLETSKTIKHRKNLNNINIKTNLMKISLNSKNSNITKIELLKYKDENNKNNLLLFNKNPKNKYKFNSGYINKKYNNLKYTKKILKKKNKIKLIFTSKIDKTKFVKTYTFKKNTYLININYKIFNKDKVTIFPKMYFNFLHNGENKKKNFFSNKFFNGFGIYTNKEKFKRIEYKNINYNTNIKKIYSNYGWMAIIQHYFTSILIMPKNSINYFLIKKINNNLFSIKNILKIKKILPNSSSNINIKLYSGPQDYKILKNISIDLENIKNFGMLTIFSKPIFWLLTNIHLIFKNWGWSIIFLTLIIKIIFTPLSISGYRNIKKIQNIIQKMNYLVNTKNNNSDILKKIIKLYKSEKINFFSSILTILIQIPFFLALFNILSNAVEFKNAAWILWINDLSSKDPYYILPIIMTLCIILQSKIGIKNNEHILKRIYSLIFPIFFSIIFFYMPSGLLLYWITNNIISILQQIYVYNI